MTRAVQNDRMKKGNGRGKIEMPKNDKGIPEESAGMTMRGDIVILKDGNNRAGCRNDNEGVLLF